MFLAVLNEDKDLTEINKTIIALIPKTKNPEVVSRYRPISLCNVVCKVVAKCLTNRLKGTMRIAIADTQGAFVEDRQIRDNLMVGLVGLITMKKDRFEN